MAKVGSLIATLGLNTARFDQGVKEAEAKARGFGQRAGAGFRQAGRQATLTTRAVSNLKTGMLSMAASAYVVMRVLRQSVTVNREFGQSMSTVRAVTGATRAEFADLSEEARRLGARTRFSASQSAEGMLYLARAGFD